jgi:hypothetical protein
MIKDLIINHSRKQYKQTSVRKFKHLTLILLAMKVFNLQQVLSIIANEDYSHSEEIWRDQQKS